MAPPPSEAGARVAIPTGDPVIADTGAGVSFVAGEAVVIAAGASVIAETGEGVVFPPPFPPPTGASVIMLTGEGVSGSTPPTGRIVCMATGISVPAIGAGVLRRDGVGAIVSLVVTRADVTVTGAGVKIVSVTGAGVSEGIGAGVVLGALPSTKVWMTLRAGEQSERVKLIVNVKNFQIDSRNK